MSEAATGGACMIIIGGTHADGTAAGALAVLWHASIAGILSFKFGAKG